MKKRLFAAALGIAMTLTMTARSVFAESSWPTGSVNLYCNQAAGGGTDMIARLLATAMGEASGQNFVVINDTSGGSITACETVRTAKPVAEDILICNSGTLTRMVTGQYPQTLDDFSVLGLASTPNNESYGIFVRADSQFESFDDLVSYAKENPGALLTNGQVGGFVMFSEAAVEKQLDFRSTFVEGGSDSDRILDLLGGSTDYAMLSTMSSAQYVEAGDLRCLALIGGEKSTLLPDVDTFTDLGYTPVKMAQVLIVFGPEGMAEEDISKCGEILKAANENETLQEGYAQLNSTWEYMDPEESKAYLDSIMTEMQDAYTVVQEMGLS